MVQVRRRTLLASGGGAFVAKGYGQSLPKGRWTNILYLHSHDSGRSLEPYDSAVSTPEIASLGREGVTFRQAFSAAPVCSPSRAALLTGQSPHRSGMIGLAHRGFRLNDPRQLLFRDLQKFGYQAVLTGMQHVAADPDTLGYDRNLAYRDESGKWRAEASVVAPIAERFLDSRPRQPFFLDVGFFETHREYPDPTPADLERVRSVPRPLPDMPEIRHDFAAFGASARQLDAGVGRVLRALSRNGYDRNTLVIFVTDHGIAFPGMKCNLTDDGIGTALIMRGPGLAVGHQSDVMVSQIDVFPTVYDYLGIPRPSWLVGQSFLPVLRGSQAEIRDAVYAEMTYHASYEPMRAVRTQRWKYIRRFGSRRQPVLPNCDDSPSKSVWVGAGWPDHHLPEEALYDLTFDPAETGNLCHDPQYGDVLREMRKRLRRWMQETQDPLLKGPVAAPVGAVVNPPDGQSPSEPTVPA
ncbi:sulfatase [Gluconobacter sp. Dm-74]|uniref:sulfatase family protein n=1 Tax=Gluconobacter sp. Dm-74 TaxID=2799803 RepID=UPI001B8B7383|nr:sulfatase [Gluconobacter sp. Dm-74]MBS1091798.1 sulfatase [Gluconobacter sp. Dm-74]